MSISIKDFRNGNFKKKVSKLNEHPVLMFLKKNKARAYTAKEIIKAIKMKEQTVRSMLDRLKKKKIIEHKIPYYTVKK